tara:strand:- start:1079 stop:1564 length:486 start_codon:yes stop_codon:yes gene_type:complete
VPSFDVVSKTDLMEVDNAVNGVKRQIKQRFDLAGTKCDVERNENSLTITADDNMKLNQLHDLLRQNLASRKVDAKALDFGKPENASGDSLRQQVMIKQGIDQDLARKINKAVKGSKMKVQITIKGSELHVSGKKRDELQETITFIKNMDTDQPLQYVNFRD